MGTAQYGQGRASSTVGKELWRLRPPAGSTFGNALNPDLLFPFYLMNTSLINFVTTTTLFLLDQILCLLCSMAEQNALVLLSSLLWVSKSTSVISLQF